MKKKKLLKITSFVLFLTLASWSVFANCNWQGQWQQKWKWNWQRQILMEQKNYKDTTLEKTHSFKVEWTLNDTEIERLVLQYEDEYAAIWIYNYFYELYWLEVFKNIANSEEKHLWAIVSLMKAYDLEIPTWLSAAFLEETERLKSMGEWSLKKALEAWVLFEIRDIEDIAKTISLTENEDIKKVMLNIGWWSFNHLRWFLNNLEKQGFTTDIDYSEFLSKEDLQQKDLKDRFIAYLNNIWISIDTTLLNTKDNKDKKWQQKWKWKSKKMKWWQKDEAFKNTQKQRKEAFKSKIDREMWNKIRSMNEDRLKILLNRLEKIRNDIKNNENISQNLKHSYMPALNALEEIVNEILNY